MAIRFNISYSWRRSKKKYRWQSGLIYHTHYPSHEIGIIASKKLQNSILKQSNVERWNRKRKLQKNPKQEEEEEEEEEEGIKRMRAKLNIKIK